MYGILLTLHRYQGGWLPTPHPEDPKRSPLFFLSSPPSLPQPSRIAMVTISLFPRGRAVDQTSQVVFFFFSLFFSFLEMLC